MARSRIYSCSVQSFLCLGFSRIGFSSKARPGGGLPTRFLAIAFTAFVLSYLRGFLTIRAGQMSRFPAAFVSKAGSTSLTVSMLKAIFAREGTKRHSLPAVSRSSACISRASV